MSLKWRTRAELARSELELDDSGMVYVRQEVGMRMGPEPRQITIKSMPAPLEIFCRRVRRLAEGTVMERGHKSAWLCTTGTV